MYINIDDMKPERCGHAAIRSVSGCLLVYNSESFNLSLTNHFRMLTLSLWLESKLDFKAMFLV